MKSVKAPLYKIFAAIFYDSLIQLALFMLVGFIAVAINKVMTGQDNMVDSNTSWLLLIILYGVSFCYYSYFWRASGQTVGMKAWKIRVVSLTSPQLNLGQLIIRYISAQLSFIFILIGYFYRWFDQEKLTVHDRLSKTTIENTKP